MKSIHPLSNRSLTLAACLLVDSSLGSSPARAQDATPPSPGSAWLPARLAWFQDLKFGFMMHWAPYSQRGGIESWPLVEEDKFGRPDDRKAWTERGTDMARFTRDYWALPKTFNPVKFDPRKWANAAKEAGMKYVVFTTKLRDGFAMFNTKLSDYRITAPDVPFHSNQCSNVVREVFNAFRKKDFAIGAYFSKSDWHCPDCWDPSAPARTRNPNYDTLPEPEKWQRFVRFGHCRHPKCGWRRGRRVRLRRAGRTSPRSWRRRTVVEARRIWFERFMAGRVSGVHAV